MSQKNIIIGIIIIVVVIVGIMLTKGEPRVSDQLDNIEVSLGECQSRLATWQTEYGNEEPRSEDGQNALDDILKDCQDTIDDADETI